MTKKQEKTKREILMDAHQAYEKKLGQYAFYKVNDKATSEDLVQDTFMKTWRYLARGGKIDLMKAFLYHILNNLIIDEYRKHKTSSLDNLIEKGFEPAVDDSSKMLDTLDGRSALSLVGHLSEKYQKVMKMRYGQDLSVKEIALLTKQSPNAVAVQIHRALKKLKLLYPKQGLFLSSR